MVLDRLALAACTRCALCTTRQRVVIGSGPARPSLVVVGEAPGRNEDDGGEPFIGRSGQLLARLLLEEVGLTREQYFITNVVKCRPPLNRTPTTAEIATCRPWLDEQLADLAPRVVLAVGNVAARALFGWREGISVRHGEAVARSTGWGLATYHPAAALRGGPNVVDVMRSDLRTLRDLLVAP